MFMLCFLTGIDNIINYALHMKTTDIETVYNFLLMQ